MEVGGAAFDSFDKLRAGMLRPRGWRQREDDFGFRNADCGLRKAQGVRIYCWNVGILEWWNDGSNETFKYYP